MKKKKKIQNKIAKEQWKMRKVKKKGRKPTKKICLKGLRLVFTLVSRMRIQRKEERREEAKKNGRKCENN
jgi:hypothetical protein